MGSIRGFDTKVMSFWKLFLKPLPGWLRDHCGTKELTKSEVCGRAWMLIKHSKFIFYMACFLPDATPRPAPDLNSLSFGWICCPCWDPLDIHFEVCWRFFSNCGLELVLDSFWILGGGWGSQVEGPTTLGEVSRHALSDIWDQSRRFRMRVVFLGFLVYLLRQEN